MKKTEKTVETPVAVVETKVEKRGRKVSTTSARQLRLARFAKMVEMGIPVRRGRYAKDAPKVTV